MVRASGSSLTARADEPTRSQKRTVSWRLWSEATPQEIADGIFYTSFQEYQAAHGIAAT